MIGLGITTFNRPKFLETACDSVDQYVGSSLGCKLIYDDGSDDYDEDLYRRLADGGWSIVRNEINNGVAFGKNSLLKSMIDAGCETLFLMEDDIQIVSADALSVYIDAMERTGIQHINFSQHGPANRCKPVERNEVLEFWPNVVGAFSAYTRRYIDLVGYFDVEFRNDLDHVHHTYMGSLSGLTSQWRGFADVVGSTNYVKEQSGAIEQSTIGHHDILEVGSPFQRSLRHWYRNYPMPADLMSLLR
jgi:hypothetical protein